MGNKHTLFEFPVSFHIRKKPCRNEKILYHNFPFTVPYNSYCGFRLPSFVLTHAISVFLKTNKKDIAIYIKCSYNRVLQSSEHREIQSYVWFI